jgi:hypothetical protein
MSDTTSEQIGSNRANWYQFDLLAMCTAVFAVAILFSLPKWLEPETAKTIYRALLGAILGRRVWGARGLLLGGVIIASFPFLIEERQSLCIHGSRWAFFEASVGALTATVYLTLLYVLRSLGIRGWA